MLLNITKYILTIYFLYIGAFEKDLIKVAFLAILICLTHILTLPKNEEDNK